MINVREVTKRFGIGASAVTALETVSLDVPEGSFFTLLGPSGCGKTTLLRLIAGFELPSEGEIALDGQEIGHLPPHKRPVNTVFQNYALFPHKTVAENIAFGLKYRDVPKSDVARRVQEALDLVQLPDVGSRYPKELSGGQQQRIALARAIVIEPEVLLLDEPLSALDANLREDMRVGLKRIQAQIGVTTVFVTHDQSEALAMSDKIVVMSAGRIEQVGTPEEVYNTPASEFVANFLGASNILAGTCVSRDAKAALLDVPLFGKVPVPADKAAAASAGAAAKLVLRAEKLVLMAPGSDTSGLVTAAAVVEPVDYQGPTVRYFLRVGDTQLQAINMIDGRPFAEGQSVIAAFRPQDCAALAGA